MPQRYNYNKRRFGRKLSRRLLYARTRPSDPCAPGTPPHPLSGLRPSRALQLSHAFAITLIVYCYRKLLIDSYLLCIDSRHHDPNMRMLCAGWFHSDRANVPRVAGMRARPRIGAIIEPSMPSFPLQDMLSGRLCPQLRRKGPSGRRKTVDDDLIVFAFRRTLGILSASLRSIWMRFAS